jgi:GH3 auxin-responsive promoter.
MYKAINKFFLTFNSHLLKEIELSKKDPFSLQRDCFKMLIKSGGESAFGKEHNFEIIKDKDFQTQVKMFQRAVPIRDYNAFVPYINRLRGGEDYVLWNQKVRWFAKSSGTSSDKSKYIPITPDSLYMNHYGGFKRMLTSYVGTFPKSKIFSGKALTLGGSVQPDSIPNIKAGYSAFSGDLSAILLKNSPFIAEFARTPKRETALKSDFSQKLEAICKECSSQNITNFAGVPSWNLMLMNKILEYTGKNNICEVWPNIELFMHGGIGFEPYREVYRSLFPSPNMHYLENYNASEGYFAFQDDLSVNSMLLTVGNGIFYEFIPMDKLNEVLNGDISEIPTLEEVKTGINYALVISSVTGLWRYLIGDCISFTSLLPHRIIITGRTQLFINAFGEELMIENAEKAIAATCKKLNCSITDFTVAPIFMNSDRETKGRHKWAIEFDELPANINDFAKELDYQVTQQNSDYEAKRSNNATMLPLDIVVLTKGTFYRWMQSRGKLGGQNKVPRLYKDSRFIDQLTSQKNGNI